MPTVVELLGPEKPSVESLLGPPPVTVTSLLGSNPAETTTSSPQTKPVGLATFEDPAAIPALPDHELQQSYQDELQKAIARSPQLVALQKEAQDRAAKGNPTFAPLLEIPKVTATDLDPNAGTLSKVIAGVNQGAAGLVEGMTSPAAIAGLAVGGAIPALARPIGAAFMAQVASTVPRQVAETATAAGSGNVEAATAGAVGLLGTAAMLEGGRRMIVKNLADSGAPATAEVMAQVIKPEVPKVETAPVQAELPVETPAPKPEAATAEAPSTPQTPLASAFATDLQAVHNNIKDIVGNLAGETLPATTRIDRVSGEMGARYLSSRIAAKPMASDFVQEVLPPHYEPLFGKIGKLVKSDIDPVKFGAALTEDNLRSVRENFVQQGDERAAAVKTLVGEDRVFKTEKEYQDYLNSQPVQDAIERYKALWSDRIEPLYKKAMMIDPDEELPSRGLQTGARVNLLPEEIAVRNEGGTPSAPAGGQLNTLKKLSPFGREATGSSEGYRTNFRDMMNNTIGRQLEIANKNAFDNSLVQSGNAVIDAPGKDVQIGGKRAVPFDYARKTLVLKTEDGTTSVPQNQKIYVNPDIAGEYRRAANLDAPLKIPGLQPVADAITKLQLAGLTDATVHVSNLATQLLTRPGIIGNTLMESSLAAAGRADIPFVVGKLITKAFSDNSKQIAELAEIGAFRDQPQTKSITAPLSGVVHWMDATTRLVMDDAYQRMVKEGLIDDTETNRREFVNQVGQYNKRAQDAFTAAARDTNLAPFITAGKTFNSLALRNISLNPGVEAAGIPEAAALKLQIAAKWTGTFALIGMVNYALTGKVGGRPGTPLGRIDTGQDDDSGRPLTIPASDLMGFGRALRITGLRGAIDAKRMGLPDQSALDSAVRDIANTATSPLIGPVMRTAATGLTGSDLAVGIPRKYPVVPPPQSQALSDASRAVMDINPIAGSIAAASEPGATVSSVLSKQLPRYIPSPGKPPAMVEKYADIVRMAKTGNFTDDMIGRVRKMSPEARNQVVTDAYYAIDIKDRAHFLRTLKQRRIDFQFVSPTNPP